MFKFQNMRKFIARHVMCLIRHSTMRMQIHKRSQINNDHVLGRNKIQCAKH